LNKTERTWSINVILRAAIASTHYSKYHEGNISYLGKNFQPKPGTRFRILLALKTLLNNIQSLQLT